MATPNRAGSVEFSLKGGAKDRSGKYCLSLGVINYKTCMSMVYWPFPVVS